MAAPYSGDLRQRVAAAVAQEASARSAAGRFGVSVSTAIRWAQRLRAEGHAQARAMGGDHRSRLVEHRAAVLEPVAKQPDLTLQEIRGALAAGHGITVGLTSLWVLSRRSKSRSKKSLHAAEQDRPDVAEARRSFIRRQPALNPDRLVFIDETWAATNMVADMAGRPAARGPRLAAIGSSAARALESDDPGGRSAHQRDYRAVRLRRRHQRRALPRLCRADASTDPEAG
jgi:transposase